MKTLFTALLLTLSIGASALEVEVYSNVYGGSKYDADIDLNGYAINPALGRAAVKLLLWDNRDDDGGNYDYITQTVNSLYYNKSTQNIMYGSTICAETRIKRGVLGRKRKIYKTGNCTFSVRKSKVSVDNGFRIKTKNKVTLYMNIK